MPRLTQAERSILAKQLLILEVLFPEHADEYSVQREAIVEGYEIHLDECLVRADFAMSVEQSKEVFETLDMFASLRESAQDLDLSEWLAEQNGGCFLGYDGNDPIEVRYMFYVDYLVNRLGRYRYLDLAGQGYVNSHALMRQTYGEMLSVWREVPRESRTTMTREQIEEIVNAG